MNMVALGVAKGGNKKNHHGDHKRVIYVTVSQMNTILVTNAENEVRMHVEASFCVQKRNNVCR